MKVRVPAVVMNLYYTGLGIARSLGEQGVPVIGLTAHRGIYGNFTRYAKTLRSPDSRTEPERLLKFLCDLGRSLESGGILFPTRDDDVLFMDRFRQELAQHFRLVAPNPGALNACVDKWETYRHAQQAAVPTPKCWLIETEEGLRRSLPEITYPCVLKPASAHAWRQGMNWQIVGGRKAIQVSSPDHLLLEYERVSRASGRLLVQELVPGADDCLWIMACYLDFNSRWEAGFNIRKLVQYPEGFGTGCIVQAASREELVEPTRRLLENMHFSGIAEVEYKWDRETGLHKLIEVNPRPWDQHRLGKSCGTDLVYIAYCEQAGVPLPETQRKISQVKWIAEDAWLTAALRMLWRRDPKIGSLFRLAKGQRMYAIWSVRDPLPLLGYMLFRYLPSLIASVVAHLRARLRGARGGVNTAKGLAYEEHP